MLEGGSPPGLLQPQLTTEQEEWLKRVADLEPLLAAHRDRSDNVREMSREVFEALRDAGLFRMWVSRAFGGGQASILTGVTVVEALARIDASVAWLVGTQAALSRLSDYLPEPVAHRLYRENTGLVIGATRPTGTAERVEGGYRLTGKWPLASGYAHARWLLCTAVVTSGGEPVVTPAGREARLLLVPREQTTAEDTWHTLGLRGTGSIDFRVDDVFVPDELSVGRTDVLRYPPERASQAYAIDYFTFVHYADAPVTLGIAQDALESFRPTVADRVPVGGTATLAESHTMQDRLARAEMLAYSARLLLWDAARQGDRYGATGGLPLTATVRLTAATVADKATAAVDTVVDLAGTSVIYRKNRLERCFRDVHTANKHISMAPAHFEMVGQYLVGGPMPWRR
ncbi:hydroxylase [Catellatospora sp. TT07R-123]|uniref:acyl-CoA dehydrogenase family protein n=1 Tax=Catellatospora sp. TT07R-123 TaxID=2733863 RepID=UPI001B05EC28|nr:acyl-CoA dehydrogenase family protein [Catellatospora sp. TT07R-123]GHJ45606.1 hydroxylase [Catellatospora sp. TT07R-123]